MDADADLPGRFSVRLEQPGLLGAVARVVVPRVPDGFADGRLSRARLPARARVTVSPRSATCSASAMPPASPAHSSAGPARRRAAIGHSLP